tara:strand:+ start:365 stop:727 length:363 start_codon:yes stop_codon:yes gene_type:complete
MRANIGRHTRRSFSSNPEIKDDELKKLYKKFKRFNDVKKIIKEENKPKTKIGKSGRSFTTKLLKSISPLKLLHIDTDKIKNQKMREEKQKEKQKMSSLLKRKKQSTTSKTEGKKRIYYKK